MTKMTILSQDLSRERRFTAFLSKKIFPVLAAEGIPVEVVTDRTLDRLGVDVTMSGTYVDIKAHELPTGTSPQRYSFERLTRHRIGDEADNVTEVVDGWLVSKKKVTQKYLICYYQQSEHRIVSVTAMLVDRKKLIDTLTARGIDVSGPVETLMGAATRAALQENGAVKYYFPGVFDISLTHSRQLPEEPLNIIVKYDTIREICDWCRTFEMDEPQCW